MAALWASSSTTVLPSEAPRPRPGPSWDRTSSREAWIPHGSEEDSYDRLVLWPMPPIRVGDEDWFYMDVIDGDHLITRNNPNHNSSRQAADRFSAVPMFRSRRGAHPKPAKKIRAWTAVTVHSRQHPKTSCNYYTTIPFRRRRRNRLMSRRRLISRNNSLL